MRKETFGVEGSLTPAETTEPKSAGYLRVWEVSLLKGKPWTWVVRRIAPFKKVLRMPVEIRGIQDVELPSGLYKTLEGVSYTNIPAEDWLTTTKLADELGVEYKWVNRRLLELNTPCEFRICDGFINRSELHFSPEALDELRLIREQAVERIDPDAYMNLAELAETIGRHRLWVSNRLDRIRVESRLGLDPTGKAVEYYPKGVVADFIKERDKHSPDGGWMTIPMLVQATGRDRQWVEMRLDQMGVEGDYRHFEKSGRVDLCFSPSVAIELEEIAASYIQPEADWYTEGRLAVILGKSHNWLRRRLRDISSSEIELRTDSRGALRKHYHPEVLERLVRIKNGLSISATLESGEEENTEDSASMFRQVFMTGKITISRKALRKFGVSDEEREMWMETGLVTRWGNGMYYFTRKAEQVVRAINFAEEKEREIPDMNLWLDE